MRFEKRPQLPGAGRTRAGHYHGSHTHTSPGTILLGKMAYHTKQIRRECILKRFFLKKFHRFLTKKIDFESTISALFDEPIIHCRILGQKSCILGPTIFKIPQPN